MVKPNVIQFPPRTETFKYRDAEVVLTYQPKDRTVRFTACVTQEYLFTSKAKDLKTARRDVKTFIDELLGEDDE